jgi:PAS domain-containing protein
MRRVRETQQSAEAEYPLPSADDNRWYQASFVPLPEGRIGIVASDVTERKQREDALRESKERFEAIAEAMPISVVITRESDGRVLYGNSVLASTFELPPERLVDQIAADFYVRPEERGQMIETLQAHRLAQRPRAADEDHDRARHLGQLLRPAHPVRAAAGAARAA